MQGFGTIVGLVLIYVLGGLVAYWGLRAAVAHGVYDALERRDAGRRAEAPGRDAPAETP